MLDPTQLIVSGAAQFYTPAAQVLLKNWLATIARFPRAADDEALDFTYNFVVQRDLIRRFWWPKEYCRYAWWIHVRPIIDHPQLPGGNPPRPLKSVADVERFKMEGLPVCRPQGLFPRDCLIDTKEKCLLRIENDGALTAIGRFSSDLWIADGA
jgi:hypothetical protein